MRGSKLSDAVAKHCLGLYAPALQQGGESNLCGEDARLGYDGIVSQRGLRLAEHGFQIELGRHGAIIEEPLSDVALQVRLQQLGRFVEHVAVCGLGSVQLPAHTWVVLPKAGKEERDRGSAGARDPADEFPRSQRVEHFVARAGNQETSVSERSPALAKGERDVGEALMW